MTWKTASHLLLYAMIAIAIAWDIAEMALSVGGNSWCAAAADINIASKGLLACLVAGLYVHVFFQDTIIRWLKWRKP